MGEWVRHADGALHRRTGPRRTIARRDLPLSNATPRLDVRPCCQRRRVPPRFEPLAFALEVLIDAVALARFALGRGIRSLIPSSLKKEFGKRSDDPSKLLVNALAGG